MCKSHDISSDSLPSSFAPSPVPLPQTNANDIELQLINDEGNLPSLPSSISPPQAPAPAPIVMTEEELVIDTNEIEKMAFQKQEIEKTIKEKEQEIEKILKEKEALEEKGKQIDTFFMDIRHYFRSICIGQRGFGFENTSFNYLHVNGFIEGGEKEIFIRDGNRFFDEVPKQKDQRLLHSKAGLLSMSLRERSTKFIITLGPMPCLDDDYVVFGEVTTLVKHLGRGMHLLNSVNRKDIRNNSRGNVANLGKQVTAVGAFQNDILMGDVQIGSADDTIVNLQASGVGTGENETEVYDGIYHNEMSIRGTPIDTIVIYACGEKD
ncbi:unnamed protein product [Rotaria magnacalcarata]|uniref:PPIase cyclophilin-type domain-containing protein n=1 Tax=Rotaria magnacalcarata TaxID=392030 RepID=A0A816ZDK5_9BILA|nr:unnamed protein product [Rotaria magnacalcarata]CAF2205173.1 unnamed protein product [Rotaria magnacalcarata]